MRKMTSVFAILFAITIITLSVVKFGIINAQIYCTTIHCVFLPVVVHFVEASATPSLTPSILAETTKTTAPTATFTAVATITPAGAGATTTSTATFTTVATTAPTATFTTVATITPAGAGATITPAGAGATITPAATFIADATPTPTATGTPATVGGVRVRSASSFLRSTTMYVVGEVVNDGSSAVYSTLVTARFFDASNQMVGTENAYASLRKTAPGQRNPFKIIFLNAPSTTSRYELTLSSSTTFFMDYQSIPVMNQQMRDNMGVEIFGEVRNDQPRELDSATVAVAFYDAAGNVIDIDVGSPSTTTISPNQTVPYHINTFNSTLTFANYQVFAEGYVISPTTLPTAPMKLRIQSDQSFLVSTTRYIVGEVINDDPATAYLVNVAAKFYDNTNQLIGVADVYTGLRATYTGQRNPFKVALLTAPSTMSRYELSVYGTPTRILNYQPITIVSQLTRDNFGVEVFGDVRNDQVSELSSVSVVVTFYDGAGLVIDTDQGSPGVTTLAAGATTPYKISTFSNLTFATFTVQGQGY